MTTQPKARKANWTIATGDPNKPDTVEILADYGATRENQETIALWFSSPGEMYVYSDGIEHDSTFTHLSVAQAMVLRDFLDQAIAHCLEMIKVVSK